MYFMGMLAVTAAACGSDDGDKGGSGASKIESGAPASTPANQLSDSQVKAFCDSAARAGAAAFGTQDAKQALCGFSGYFLSLASGGSGDAAGVCKMAYDECLKAPAETSTSTCEKPSATCTATIGEIEACLNDSMAQVSQMLEALPGCDDVGKPLDGAAPTEQQSPASCQVVQQKCPEALDQVPDPSASFG
jgi:hypothetical protein